MCQHNTLSYILLDGKLKSVDRCIASFILQLNLAGIKTIGCCCGHGSGYPNVTCVPGTEYKLEKIGCKIFVTRKDGCVEAYFPVNSYSGKVYPVQD